MINECIKYRNAKELSLVENMDALIQRKIKQTSIPQQKKELISSPSRLNISVYTFDVYDMLSVNVIMGILSSIAFKNEEQKQIIK